MFLRSEEATKCLGKNIAKELVPNSLLLLKGPIGSGKTSIVKGIAEGLCVKENITSPTFALSHHYDSGLIPIIHMDLYRLEAEISAKQLFWEEEEEAKDNGAILIIEWPELILSSVKSFWLIEIEYAKDFGREYKLYKPLDFKKV